MKIFNIFIISFLIGLTINSSAQTKLKFDLDFARFAYDSTNAYLELYYEIDQTTLKKATSENGFEISANLHIEIYDVMNDSLYVKKQWRIQREYPDSLAPEFNKSQTGVLGFLIPPSDYRLTAELIDNNDSNNRLLVQENFNVDKSLFQNVSMSDIQLAVNIKKDGADKNSLFYKNTLEVIPNPAMIYSDKSPVLFYYTELYNLEQNKNTNYKLYRSVVNSKGRILYDKAKMVKSNSKSIIDVAIINLSKYPTDSYDLTLSLVDTTSKEALVSSKRFFLVNPNVVDTFKNTYAKLNYMKSEFGVYSLDECDENFSMAKYIATREELKQYKLLSLLDAKREFLFNFWARRDFNPQTLENEYKVEYMNRVEYANEYFRYIGRPGYKTDRGRVLLIYGQPDLKDYYPNESNLKPYEVWTYHGIEGGVSFIFGDITGFSKYELVHSTKRGEYYDPDWQKRLIVQ